MLVINLSNLQNSYKSHNLLAKVSELCCKTSEDTILIDFKKVSFITANHFAIIGSILFDCLQKNKTIKVANLSDKISNILQVNGFANHLGLPRKKDIFNTAIPYKIFHIDEINQFERHILISLFSRRELPTMSNGVRNAILDNILEIFINVIEHAASDYVFTCGQFFPKKQLLYLTISDMGRTIQKNVSEYYLIRGEIPPDSCLKWALQIGNSTRQVSAPGGLGLSIISEFIEKNNGELFIISGNETYEQTSRGKRIKTFDYYYAGTAVTIGFNINDESIYLLDHEDYEDFIGGI